MKKCLLMVLLLSAALGQVVMAQLVGAVQEAPKYDLSSTVPLDKKLVKGRLPNGLTYYIRANKKPENRVQFRLVTNAGSVLEDESQRGLAHFTEHMAFNGIKGYPHNELISTLQKYGIEFGREINAYTSFDETVYYVNLPSDDTAMLNMGYRILDGWSSGLLFDAQELEEERGVIHEEWRGGQGAGERLRDKTWPIMLRGSQYAERMPIGLERVIMGFKRDDIVRFYNDWYRTDLQAVVIVGDIDPVEVEAKIKEVFGGRSKVQNPKPRNTFDVPANKEPLIAIATDHEATSTSMVFYWKHGPIPQGTVGDYRTSLLYSLVVSMINDRLNELCEKPESPMTGAGAGYGGFLSRETSVFTLAANVKEGQSAPTAATLLTEVRRACQHGFLQSELDRQKEELLSSYARSAKEADKTDNTSHASEYTRNFLTGEPVPGIRQEWRYAKAFLPDITIEECNQAMRSWITDTNLVAVITAPEGVALLTEPQLLSIITSCSSIATEPWVDDYKDEPLLADELPQVNAKITKQNQPLDYTEYTCPNGVRFVVKQTNLKADEIQMQSYAWGGTSLYDDDNFYMAQNASGLVDNAGIAQFSASQLGKLLKGKNLSVSPYINALTQGFTGNCSPKDLEPMLQMVYLYYTHPRRDQESLDKDIENIKNQIKFINQNPHYVFLKSFYEAAYPGSKRVIVCPNDEQIATLQLDAIHQVFRDRFHDASNQTFLFVGNVSNKDVQLIAKYLGNLPADGTQKEDTYQDRMPKFAKGVVRTQAVKGTDKQGKMIMYGETLGFQPTMENRMIVTQLNDALNITALEVIREKMGGTYSPSVDISCSILPKGNFTWMFYIECDPDKAGEIEKALLGIINDYAKHGPSAETLAKVQQQQIINRETSMQNNGYWMGQIMASYQYNESHDGAASLENYAERVHKVTRRDIQKMAKQFINTSNCVITTLVPE